VIHAGGRSRSWRARTAGIIERTTWLVVTRWRDEQAFQAWLHSPAFGRGHRAGADDSGAPPPSPVGISSELWSYEVAGGSAG
jgi:heme-degrading monooxygenase HmoA